MKLTPASKAVPTMASTSLDSSRPMASATGFEVPPNVIVPRHILDTNVPVPPSLAYCIVISPGWLEHIDNGPDLDALHAPVHYPYPVVRQVP